MQQEETGSRNSRNEPPNKGTGDKNRNKSSSGGWG